MTLETAFGSVLDNTTASIGIGAYLLCTLFSLALGLVAAGFYSFRNPRRQRSFVVTIALLPAIVQLVIMLVNGNIGAGIAVMGAFSLVKFRSIPGSAKDIAAIFLSMAIGLATGMGFLGIATVFAIMMGVATIVYAIVPAGQGEPERKQLKITIPETLDYCEIFDDLFDEYTRDHSLEMVKTTNMGSLYQLRYDVTFKRGANEKEFLDKIRCRNGNLEVALGRQLFGVETL